MTRVALLGYGAVASIHAKQLARQPKTILSAIYGPSLQKAVAFAQLHDVESATTKLDEALSDADAAVVCSPTNLHVQQAAACLDHGIPTLIELPPCETAKQARSLGDRAAKRGLVLQCAHTSRYLEPYLRFRDEIAKGTLGTIEQIAYVRYIVPRQRSWNDDALLHHAAHPLDLLLEWFGALRPLAVVARPVVCSRDVALLAALPGGAPVSISISYTTHIQEARMTVVGAQHTAFTDGFGKIRSDLAGFVFNKDGQGVYEQAIHDQDTAFLAACCGERSGVSWQQTVSLLCVLDRCREKAQETGQENGTM